MCHEFYSVCVDEQGKYIDYHGFVWNRDNADEERDERTGELLDFAYTYGKCENVYFDEIVGDPLEAVSLKFETCQQYQEVRRTSPSATSTERESAAHGFTSRMLEPIRRVVTTSTIQKTTSPISSSLMAKHTRRTPTLGTTWRMSFLKGSSKASFLKPKSTSSPIHTWNTCSS